MLLRLWQRLLRLTLTLALTLTLTLTLTPAAQVRGTFTPVSPKLTPVSQLEHAAAAVEAQQLMGIFTPEEVRGRVRIRVRVS